jgi:hypothetical protein
MSIGDFPIRFWWSNGWFERFYIHINYSPFLSFMFSLNYSPTFLKFISLWFSHIIYSPTPRVSTKKNCYSGIRSINNVFHIVNKVENVLQNAYIFVLIDNVEYVVYALYSSISVAASQLNKVWFKIQQKILASYSLQLLGFSRVQFYSNPRVSGPKIVNSRSRTVLCKSFLIFN